MTQQTDHSDRKTTGNEALGQLQSASLLPTFQKWWDEHARALPWRVASDQTVDLTHQSHRPPQICATSPWGVLVCEVMSQQTPMSRVAPLWSAWMERWPTPRALASASTSEVLTAWGSLGYPSRALRLRRCAQEVSEHYDGQLPVTVQELTALPGIGPYTASAVASFANCQPVAVTDTNIRRVITRAAEGKESLGGATTRADWDQARSLLPTVQNPNDPAIDGKDDRLWNQVLMEIGALVCTPRDPLCDDCPLESLCRWRAAGYPGAGAKHTRPVQKWAGTDRQMRGRIMKLLRHASSQGTAHLPRGAYEKLGAQGKEDQLARCISGLAHDGLIVVDENGTISFPS
jgi:A/G-specific adenine glycosylase